MKRILSKVLVIGALTLVGTSCANDFLDRKPLDQIGPSQYYKNDTQLEGFSIDQYDHAFNSFNHQFFSNLTTLDDGTDNQAGLGGFNSKLFTKDIWKVPATGDLGLGHIRSLNYFINEVEANIKTKGISGAESKINQALGEAYFFRAFQYFGKLKTYGDFPIVKETLPNKEEILVEHAKRQPRNEVARFILSDLDKAIELLPETFPRNQRLTKKAAHLFRSRVALYEGTFEKYHAGSGRVPGDASWPGKDKEWNKGKTFNQAEEVKYFLTEAMKDAKVVADAVELTPNSKKTNPESGPHGWNPYFEMFGVKDPSVYSEVILWREYDKTANVVHNSSQRMSAGTGTGWTRGLVESFLTSDGKPYYTVSSTRSDATLKEVKKDRDNRLQLFIFAEDDVMSMDKNPAETFQAATLLASDRTQETTGYRQRKGKDYDPANLTSTITGTSGYVIFRASEAYLNYIEASYVLNSNLTTEAKSYWEKLRVRAGIKANSIDETVSATDMGQEANVKRASYDWAAFSGAKAIDATLYSIRRERRCELAGEGFRMDDLIRWRAMDQVKNYHLEGVNFWDKIYDYSDYKSKEGASLIVADKSSKANVSSKELSKYIQPYRIIEKNNEGYFGYTFRQGHYLSPFSVEEMQLCSPTKDEKNSNLYQNPGWTTTANTDATE